MNARKPPANRVSLSVTVLALCWAWVLGPSCAAAPAVDSGGTGGSGGSGGSGGDGSGRGAGGNGGGGSSDEEVSFEDGKASGPLDGKAFVTLGRDDAVSDPVCDNSGSPDGAEHDPITKENPCEGTTKWNDPASLCITGSIPIVEKGDYKNNFGLQIVVNSSEPAYSDTEGHTLDKSFTKVAFHYDQGRITPTLGASLLRVLVHKGGDDEESAYCAILTGSGEPIELTSFNTKCWPGETGDDLPADDIPKIDKVGIQISSDDKEAYEVDNFCLQRIVFSK